MKALFEAWTSIVEITFIFILTTFRLLVIALRLAILLVGFVVIGVASIFTMCDFERDWAKLYGFVWGIRTYFDDVLRRANRWVLTMKKRYE